MELSLSDPEESGIRTVKQELVTSNASNTPDDLTTSAFVCHTSIESAPIQTYRNEDFGGIVNNLSFAEHKYNVEVENTHKQTFYPRPTPNIKEEISVSTTHKKLYADSQETQTFIAPNKIDEGGSQPLVPRSNFRDDFIPAVPTKYFDTALSSVQDKLTEVAEPETSTSSNNSGIMYLGTIQSLDEEARFKNSLTKYNNKLFNDSALASKYMRCSEIEMNQKDKVEKLLDKYNARRTLMDHFTDLELKFTILEEQKMNLLTKKDKWNKITSEYEKSLTYQNKTKQVYSELIKTSTAEREQWKREDASEFKLIEEKKFDAVRRKCYTVNICHNYMFQMLNFLKRKKAGPLPAEIKCLVVLKQLNTEPELLLKRMNEMIIMKMKNVECKITEDKAKVTGDIDAILETMKTPFVMSPLFSPLTAMIGSPENLNDQLISSNTCNNKLLDESLYPQGAGTEIEMKDLDYKVDQSPSYYTRLQETPIIESTSYAFSTDKDAHTPMNKFKMQKKLPPKFDNDCGNANNSMKNVFALQSKSRGTEVYGHSNAVELPLLSQRVTRSTSRRIQTVYADVHVNVHERFTENVWSEGIRTRKDRVERPIFVKSRAIYDGKDADLISSNSNAGPSKSVKKAKENQFVTVKETRQERYERRIRKLNAMIEYDNYDDGENIVVNKKSKKVHESKKFRKGRNSNDKKSVSAKTLKLFEGLNKPTVKQEIILSDQVVTSTNQKLSSNNLTNTHLEQEIKLPEQNFTGTNMYTGNEFSNLPNTFVDQENPLFLVHTTVQEFDNLTMIEPMILHEYFNTAVEDAITQDEIVLQYINSNSKTESTGMLDIEEIVVTSTQQQQTVLPEEKRSLKMDSAKINPKNIASSTIHPTTIKPDTEILVKRNLNLKETRKNSQAIANKKNLIKSEKKKYEKLVIRTENNKEENQHIAAVVEQPRIEINEEQHVNEEGKMTGKKSHSSRHKFITPVKNDDKERVKRKITFDSIDREMQNKFKKMPRTNIVDSISVKMDTCSAGNVFGKLEEAFVISQDMPNENFVPIEHINIKIERFDMSPEVNPLSDDTAENYDLNNSLHLDFECNNTVEVESELVTTQQKGLPLKILKNISKTNYLIQENHDPPLPGVNDCRETFRNLGFKNSITKVTPPTGSEIPGGKNLHHIQIKSVKVENAVEENYFYEDEKHKKVKVIKPRRGYVKDVDLIHDELMENIHKGVPENSILKLLLQFQPMLNNLPPVPPARLDSDEVKSIAENTLKHFKNPSKGDIDNIANSLQGLYPGYNADTIAEGIILCAIQDNIPFERVKQIINILDQKCNIGDVTMHQKMIDMLHSCLIPCHPGREVRAYEERKKLLELFLQFCPKENINLGRTLLYDILSHLGTQRIPLAYEMISDWPQLIPVLPPNQSISEMSLVFQCIVHFMTNEDSNKNLSPEYINEIKQYIKCNYNIEDKRNTLEIMDDMIHAIHEQTRSKKDIIASVNLLARRLTPAELRLYVIETHLWSILVKHSNFPSSKNEKAAIITAHCLGIAGRLLPHTDEHQICVLNIINIFANMLVFNDGSVNFKRAAVHGLLYISRNTHLKYLCGALAPWVPSDGDINETLLNHMKNWAARRLKPKLRSSEVLDNDNTRATKRVFKPNESTTINLKEEFLQ